MGGRASSRLRRGIAFALGLLIGAAGGFGLAMFSLFVWIESG